MHTRDGLKGPVNFWLMTSGEYKRVCNGAGSKGWGWLVPDTMYGLSVTKAADMHDFMYHWAAWSREECDKLFYENMVSIIDRKGGLLRLPRRVRAYTYYKAVRMFGAFAYGG